jgi:hypothetical protein
VTVQAIIEFKTPDGHRWLWPVQGPDIAMSSRDGNSTVKVLLMPQPVEILSVKVVRD